jgi:hypothetical protein
MTLTSTPSRHPSILLRLLLLLIILLTTMPSHSTKIVQVWPKLRGLAQHFD